MGLCGIWTDTIRHNMGYTHYIPTGIAIFRDGIRRVPDSFRLMHICAPLCISYCPVSRHMSENVFRKRTGHKSPAQRAIAPDAQRTACSATTPRPACWMRVCVVGNSNWQSGWTSPGGIVSGKRTSSPIITVGCWLRGSCPPRWNDYLAGLSIMAFG